jgi:hypothetical protein
MESLVKISSITLEKERLSNEKDLLLSDLESCNVNLDFISEEKANFGRKLKADREFISSRIRENAELTLKYDKMVGAKNVTISICEENLRACRNDLKSKSRLYTDISKERAVLEKFLGDCSREQSEERQKHVSSLNDLKSMVYKLELEKEISVNMTDKISEDRNFTLFGKQLMALEAGFQDGSRASDELVRDLSDMKMQMIDGHKSLNR